MIDKNTVSKYKDRIRKRVSNEHLLRILRKIYYVIVNDDKGKKELEQEFSEKKKYTDKMVQVDWLRTKEEAIFEKLENRILETIFLYDEVLKEIERQDHHKV
ncbi:hypothetical protein D3Z36_11640 [Lachnospiraceae bacterium]|nr:hypothetical protein [Lachnospiraceae bacterium]